MTVYLVNGIALDDDTRGWVCRDESRPLAQFDVELTSLQAAGRDGVVPGLRRRQGAPTIMLMVETPEEHQQALRSLFTQKTLILTNPTKYPDLQAPVELVGRSPFGYGDADEVVELTVMLRIPELFWRDDTVTTSDAAALGSGSVQVEVMAGLSAPVRDALVRIKGGVTDLRVADADGSWFEYGAALANGHYLRFDSATGQAWDTNSDTWTGGTEVTGYISTGPGAYPLELTPQFTTDPDDRSALLTVTSDTRTGAPTIEVRGQRAYEV